jgi:hypothetical protein
LIGRAVLIRPAPDAALTFALKFAHVLGVGGGDGIDTGPDDGPGRAGGGPDDGSGGADHSPDEASLKAE